MNVEHFCFEVARAVCTTQSLFNLANPAPFYPEYLRYVYYISNKKDDYLARTMKQVTDQLILHDASEKKEDIREKVSLDVANAALDFMVPGLIKAMKDGSTEEVPLPSRLCLGYIHRIDEYEFDRSMRLGIGQTPDSLGHVLSVAAYVGNTSLVESFLDPDNIYCNFRSNILVNPCAMLPLKVTSRSSDCFWTKEQTLKAEDIPHQLKITKWRGCEELQECS